MKNHQQKSHTASTHQTVTEAIKLRTGQKTITISTTEQKLSAHAGQTTFWGFLHLQKFRPALAAALPHVRTSPNALKVTEIALGFIAGILAGADKLTRIAHLRGDPLLPEVMEIKRMPSQSTLSRFLGGFDGAAKNLRSFRALWHHGMRQLPSLRGGYTLDLDSTSLLHEDGQQEGVKVGYTRKGLKPCFKPLLAVLEEAKLVAQFWLRSGNSPCASNVVGFTLELLSNLPRHLRLRLVRADSGFCEDRWLSLLEERRLPYIVVGVLHHKITSLLRKETIWHPSAVPGTDVSELIYRGARWSRERRLILIRHRLSTKTRTGGKMLIECPGYAYQGPVRKGGDFSGGSNSPAFRPSNTTTYRPDFHAIFSWPPFFNDLRLIWLFLDTPLLWCFIRLAGLKFIQAASAAACSSRAQGQRATIQRL